MFKVKSNLLSYLSLVLIMLTVVACGGQEAELEGEADLLLELDLEEDLLSEIPEAESDNFAVETLNLKLILDGQQLEDLTREVDELSEARFEFTGLKVNIPYQVEAEVFNTEDEKIFAGSKAFSLTKKDNLVEFRLGLAEELAQEYDVRSDYALDDNNRAVIYYQTEWANPYIHYRLEETDWTELPGVKMLPAEYEGYYRIEIETEGASYIKAAFNDGANNWDNNQQQDYLFTDTKVTVADGELSVGPPKKRLVDDSLPQIPDHLVNETMYQAFYWEAYPGLWNDLPQMAEALAEIGVTSFWLPPAAKAMPGEGEPATESVGYSVYDFWDLGEFDQHHSKATRYGTKAELERALAALNNLGVEAYFDVVFNHRMGAGATEWVGGREVWTDFDLAGREKYYTPERWGDLYHDFNWDWQAFNGTDNQLFPYKSWDNTYSQAYLMGKDVDYSQEEIVAEMKAWGEWIINDIGFNGFRMDATAHIDREFKDSWLDHVQQNTADDIFFVAEAWVGDVYNYLEYMGNENLKAFDFCLRDDFVALSQGNKDFRYWGGVINSDRRDQAVTFVDNHDTSREDNDYNVIPIDRFKNQAYAYILMREAGLPTIYARDYDEFGMQPTLDKLIEARRYFAYGRGHEVTNNDAQTYSYIREGLAEVPGTGLVMMISDSQAGGLQEKRINSRQPNTEFYDYTGNVSGIITTDDRGYGQFKVHQSEGRGWSVWVPKE